MGMRGERDRTEAAMEEELTALTMAVEEVTLARACDDEYAEEEAAERVKLHGVTFAVATKNMLAGAPPRVEIAEDGTRDGFVITIRGRRGAGGSE